MIFPKGWPNGMSRIFHRIGLMDVSKLCLRFWGVWPPETIGKDGRRRKWYKNCGTFAIGWYVLFNVSQSIQCVRLILHREPFGRISKCLSVVVTLVLMIWKLLIYRRNGIPEQCVAVTKTERRFRCNDDPEVRHLYANVIRRNNWMNVWIIGTSIVTLAAFIGVSFVELAAFGPGFWQDNSTVFMHELYLPFDRQKAHLLIISMHIVTGTMSVILNAALQTAFFALIFYVALRFQVLQHDLRKLEFATESTVKKILKDHRDLISYVGNFNGSTNLVLLMSFLLNSVKVAAVLSQMIAVKNIALLAFPIFYSFMLISEVVLLGWMCNQIKEESSAIAMAAYDTAWYDESRDVKMLILLMICRAQKPLTMAIGPFGPMTTSTIVTTLNAAYSYMALMMD